MPRRGGPLPRAGPPGRRAHEHVAASRQRPPAEEVGIHRDLTLTSTFVASAARIRRWAVERRQPVGDLRSAWRRYGRTSCPIWNMAGLSLTLLSELRRSRYPDRVRGRATTGRRLRRRDPWMSPFATRVRGSPESWPGSPGCPPTSADLGGPGRFCFASEWLRRHCEKATGWSFPDTRRHALGVDLRDFPLVVVAPTRPFAGRLLYVGRLDPTKGVHTLVRALAQLPALDDARRGRSGRASQMSELRALVEELGLDQRVRFGDGRAAGSEGALPGSRRRGVPERVGGAVRHRAARGHGVRGPGRRHRHRRVGRVPPRRDELPALPARRRRRARCCGHPGRRRRGPPAPARDRRSRNGGCVHGGRAR